MRARPGLLPIYTKYGGLPYEVLSCSCFFSLTIAFAKQGGAVDRHSRCLHKQIERAWRSRHEGRAGYYRSESHHDFYMPFSPPVPSIEQ